MGGIIWLVIIIWIVYAVSKNKNQGKRPGQSQQKTSNTATYGDRNQQELKERLSKKYNKTTEPNILQRAKASVGKEFADDRFQAAEAKRPTAAERKPSAAPSATSAAASSAVHKTVSNAKPVKDGGKNTDLKFPEQDVSSDVMKKVEELMVVGPDMQLTFSRDFVAEGIELLNRIQV